MGSSRIPAAGCRTGEAVALRLEPAPDPAALFAGLAAEVSAADCVPFLLGGDLALYGETPAPFLLLGARSVATWRGDETPGAGAAMDFPWQRGTAGVLKAMAAFCDLPASELVLEGREVPFAAGAVVGWIGHELGASRLARYDTLIYFDGVTGKSWVLAGPAPCLPGGEAPREAAERAQALAARLPDAEARGRRAIERRTGRGERPRCAPEISRDAYERAVRAVLERIAAGDVYQVNLSHGLRLANPWSGPADAATAFLDLWRHNPVPFPACILHGDQAVLALSPERYLARRGDWIESRPIKGTRPRGASPEEDRRLAAELTASAKDRAENLMIVDLVRNDLGRVAVTGGVEVAALCEVESFTSVHHLVSTVRARLAPGVGLEAILAAAHPAGSMTGAPKISAVDILCRLEGAPRGAYAGGIGWLAGPRHFDLAMTIRALIAARGEVRLPVGGGIVADSDPAEEYAETLHKAAALLGPGILSAAGSGFR